ncbi:MAG: preprotein translocase subunit SecE [Patescibacteria group bacterium]|nr:preprotein translocase subunit SecE [Patescibacteria group bacterium]
MKKFLVYLSEVKAELAKVTWPDKTSVTKLTLTVLLVSAIVGLYVGALDLGFTKLLELLVSR